MTAIEHDHNDINDEDDLRELIAGLAQLAETDAWQNYAACRGVDPVLFFPERGASTKEAKAVCAGCPVQEQCAETAIVTREKFGVWGGLSERERRKIRRLRNIQAPKRKYRIERRRTA